jgi:hypothetical protein
MIMPDKRVERVEGPFDADDKVAYYVVYYHDDDTIESAKFDKGGKELERVAGVLDRKTLRSRTAPATAAASPLRSRTAPATAAASPLRSPPVEPLPDEATPDLEPIHRPVAEPATAKAETLKPGEPLAGKTPPKP